MRPPRARRRRAPARPAGRPPARAPSLPRRAPPRAARARRGSSRTGTCRGSTSSDGRTEGRSHLPDMRSRGARGRARPAPSEREQLVGDRQQPLRLCGPLAEGVHRAVVGVEVDAFAFPRRATAQEHRADERPGREQRARDELTRRHLPPCPSPVPGRGPARAAPRSSAGTSSGRRRRGPRSARASSSPQSGARRRARRRRCRRWSPPPVARPRAAAPPRPRAGASRRRRAVRLRARRPGSTRPSRRRERSRRRRAPAARFPSDRQSPGPRPSLRAYCRAMRRVLSKFFADRGTHLAAMIAYFALLSFVPLLFLALAVLGLVHQADEGSFFVRELSKTFPNTSLQSILRAVRGIQENATALGLVGAAFLLWSSLSFFSVLESAFNIVYGRPNRGFLHGKALATLMMVASLLSLFASLVIASIGSEILKRYAGFSGNTVFATAVSVVISGIGIFVFLASAYYVLTNVELTWREVLPGAVAATVTLEATFQLLPAYIRVSKHNPVLQTLSGPAVLLVWLYVMANVIVLGAEVNWHVAERLRRAPARPALDASARPSTPRRAR